MARKDVSRDSFLSEFLSGGGKGKRRPTKPSDLHKQTVKHDRWDREDFESIMDEMREMAAAEDRLTEIVETGGSAFADQFYALMKASPEQVSPKQVRPSHQVNHAVLNEAMGLKEYEELRMYSTGDEIASALGCIAMEPELETLFDKLEQEQKMAKELQKQLDEWSEQDGQESSLEDLIKQLEEQDFPDPDQMQDYQDQQAAAQAAKQALEQAMGQGQQALDDALAQQQANMKAGMRGAMKEAIDQAEQAEASAQAWGLEPGQLQRMPYEKRIELAKRMNNDRFKKIAKLFGPMSRYAFSQQQKKVTNAPEEIFDIETGAELSRILPMELAALRHPLLRLEFYRKYFERGLMQYKMKGTEKLAKGGIIFCEDGSGSMSGDREIWAKAVGLTLLQIAKAQNRPFHGIHFGSPRQIMQFDFSDPRHADIEKVLEFAEIFFNGGTDFMTPLSAALDILRKEHEAKGAVKADIVFATDGQCGVPQDWLEEFKAEQERIAFRVYGVIIGGSVASEPLNTIADGRVLTISDLTTGGDLGSVFGSL